MPTPSSGWQVSKTTQDTEQFVAPAGGNGVFNPPTRENILSEAFRLTTGDRRTAYGHPLDDFGCVAAVLTALGFRRYGRPGPMGKLREIVAEDVNPIMQAMKLEREWNEPKRDNRVDGAGYWGTLDECYHERERRRGDP